MQMRNKYVYVKVRHTICMHSNQTKRLLCSELLVGLPWLVNLSFVPGMQLQLQQVKAHFPHWPYEISAR